MRIEYVIALDGRIGINFVLKSLTIASKADRENKGQILESGLHL